MIILISGLSGKVFLFNEIVVYITGSHYKKTTLKKNYYISYYVVILKLFNFLTVNIRV